MEKQERFYSVKRNFLFDKFAKQDDPLTTYHDSFIDYFQLLDPVTHEILAHINMGVSISFSTTRIYQMDELDEINKTIRKYLR